jgi:transposase
MLVVLGADTVASFFTFPRGPDAMRYMLTDELWAVMGPLVARAKRHKGGQQPEVPDRAFFEAVLYWARTGIPWRDLPAEFGAWDAVYNRLRRWVYSGSLRTLFELLTADPELGEVRRVLIDSTIVRAHQHAAGAGRKKKRSGRPGRRGSRLSAAAAAG